VSLFVVDNDVAHDNAVQQSCVQVGLLKSGHEALTQGRRASRQELRWMRTASSAYVAKSESMSRAL
jgi:hypothetical protein